MCSHRINDDWLEGFRQQLDYLQGFLTPERWNETVKYAEKLISGGEWERLDAELSDMCAHYQEEYATV